MLGGLPNSSSLMHCNTAKIINSHIWVLGGLPTLSSTIHRNAAKIINSYIWVDYLISSCS